MTTALFRKGSGGETLSQSLFHFNKQKSEQNPEEEAFSQNPTSVFSKGEPTQTQTLP